MVRGGPARVPVSWCAGCHHRHDTVEAIEAGIGDTFANWLKKAGVAPCGGCNQRKEWLNGIIPYNGQVR